MNLKFRSYQKELLDEDNIPFEDIKQNMKELDFINTWLGGHDISINGFKKIIGSRKNISICEIGCGGGDNLAAIYKWCYRKRINLTITGIDLKSECIAFAKTKSGLPENVRWIVSDYAAVHFDVKPDVIFSSLFCHHFNEAQLIKQFAWMRENSNLGFFINDLQRHILAYYSIKLLTSVFSSSYLVKNDAPLSVARGFKKYELHQLFKQSGIKNYVISWKWAFRYLITYEHAK